MTSAADFGRYAPALQNRGNPAQRKAPIFNRRHYLWLAAFIAQVRGSSDDRRGIITQRAVRELATMLASENPAFNRQAFLKAAGVPDAWPS